MSTGRDIFVVSAKITLGPIGNQSVDDNSQFYGVEETEGIVVVIQNGVGVKQMLQE